MSITVASGKRGTYKSTSAVDTFIINDDTKGATITNVTGGDIIAIEGFAADFTAKASGRTVTLTSTVDTAIVIKIQLANATGATASVRFLDGDLTATYTAAVGKTKAHVDLGTQLLTTKAVAVSDAALGANDSVSTFDETSGGGSSSTGTTFTLTTGIDQAASFTGGSGNDTFNAVDGATATFSALDALDGGTGTDTLNWVNTLAPITAAPVAATVTGIETLNLTTTQAITALDTSGFTGLTAINATVSAAAVTSLTAAATTAVSVVDSAGAVTVIGGLKQTVSTAGAVTLTKSAGAVSVTETGVGQLANAISVNGGTAVNVASVLQSTGTITVGNTTAPTGDITVTTGIVNDKTGGLISLTGGVGTKAITVTESATNAVFTNVTAESAVTAVGSTTTTSVSVTQAAVVAGANAVTGVTGVAAVGVVAAAPGTAAVAAVVAVNQVTAVTAVAGITANGVVTITDAGYNTTAANTIATVTLNNYGALSNIFDNALTTLNLSGTAGDLTITNATNGGGGVPTTNATLALNLNNLSGANTITDTLAEITTLNVTTSGKASKLAAFTDTGLTTLNVAGDQVFTLSTINGSLTKIAVTGAAGFNDGGTTGANGFAALGAAATLTTTSSGAITASVNATTQTFVGSTGKDTITINALAAGDATKVITGGSGTTDELILEGAGAYGLTAAKTGVKVTGFETLGVAANVTGTVDMSTLATGFTALHVIGNGTIAFSKVAATTSTLNLDTTSTSTTVTTAAANGSATAITVNLGSATTDGVTFGTIVLKDANAVGLGTVNLVSNGVNITAGDAVANFNTVTTLTDNGLSTLNFSGTQGLAITNLNEATTQATAITINNTNTGAAGLTVGTLTDTNLGSLTFTGSGHSVISTLTDASSTTLGITNTGTQTARITAITTTGNLVNLTLTGNTQIGTGVQASATGAILTATTGITVSGATDHASVTVVASGAAAATTDTITLGNGNNNVSDLSVAGTVNVTVGTGSNYIILGDDVSNTTGAFNLTLGTHTLATGPDYIFVGTGGTAFATVANYIITGAVTGDRVNFLADAGTTFAGTLTATTAGSTLALTITAINTAADTAHGVAYAVFGGNTYVAEAVNTTEATTNNTLIELVGTHTFTGGAGFLTVAS